MNIGATFVSDPQSTVLEQPRNGPFHGPAMNAQSAAVFRPTPCQDGDNMSLTQLATVGLRVIGSVPLDTVRTAAGPSPLACDRGNRIDQRQQLRDIVAIGGRDLHGQRNAVGVDDQMVLGARLASICGVRTRLPPPKTARIESESTKAREKSIWSAPRSFRSKTLWTSLQTPAFCQSRRRRQQVIPLPQPISLGSHSHWMPLLRTNRIPVSTARLSRGFQPGYRNRLFLTGSKGRISFHSRSSNSGFAISSSLYLSLLRR